MTDIEYVNSFKDYLIVERAYSDHTVNSYIEDIKEFIIHIRSWAESSP